MRISWKQFEQQFKQHDGWRAVANDSEFTQGRHLEAICRVARASKAKRVIEIGTAQGHTTVALARTLPDAKIVTIGTTRPLGADKGSPFDDEILETDAQGAYIRAQASNIRARIHSIVDEPKPRMSLLSQHVVGRFEFAFIDGDHTWQCVAEDTKAVLRKIVDDGIVVWDDYVSCREVNWFIDALNTRTSGKITAIRDTRIVFARLDAELRAELLKAAELL